MAIKETRNRKDVTETDFAYECSQEICTHKRYECNLEEPILKMD